MTQKKKLIIIGVIVTFAVTISATIILNTINKGNKMYGQVTSVSDDTISIAILKDASPLDNNPEAHKSSPDTKNETTLPELTGEEKTVKITNSTVVERFRGKTSSMGSKSKISEVSEGDIVTLTLSNPSTAEKISLHPSQRDSLGSPSKNKQFKLKGKYEVEKKTKRESDKSYKADNRNESSVLVKNGGNLTLSNSTLTKSGDSASNKESQIYALNSILAVTENSKATIKNTKLTSDSKGSSAIAAAGMDSKVTARETIIDTKGDFSSGVSATLGGEINADNIKISTKGEDSASIDAHEEAGSIRLNNSSSSTAGKNSPIIYSKGNVKLNKCSGSADNTEIAVVTGKGSVDISDTTLNGKGQNGIVLSNNITGIASKIKIEDSSLVSKSEGAMFYVTNTKADTTIKNTSLSHKGNTLIRVSGNRKIKLDNQKSTEYTFTAVNQQLKGDIYCDEISTTEFNLTKGSSYKGAINNKNTAKNLKVSIDKTSKWTLADDCYVNSIVSSADNVSNIDSKGYNIYYDKSNPDNSWLRGRTINLHGGGRLTPVR